LREDSGRGAGKQRNEHGRAGGEQQMRILHGNNWIGGGRVDLERNGLLPANGMAEIPERFYS
jgi:hypothetical protein